MLFRAVATVAGGCLWAQEEGFDQLIGVREVISGYAGGTVKNPTYQEVGTDRTGHAESVQVYYDPKGIRYTDLPTPFFSCHDPHTPTRQPPDPGQAVRAELAEPHRGPRHRRLRRRATAS